MIDWKNFHTSNQNWNWEIEICEITSKKWICIVHKNSVKHTAVRMNWNYIVIQQLLKYNKNSILIIDSI